MSQRDTTTTTARIALDDNRDLIEGARTKAELALRRETDGEATRKLTRLLDGLGGLAAEGDRLDHHERQAALGPAQELCADILDATDDQQVAEWVRQIQQRVQLALFGSEVEG